MLEPLVRRQDDPPLRTSAATPPRAIRMALMKASTFSSESRTTTGSLKSGPPAAGKSFIATATTPVSRLIAPTVSKAWGRNSLPVISCPSLFVVIFNSPFMVGIVYLLKLRSPGVSVPSNSWHRRHERNGVVDVDRRIRPVEFAGGRLHDERLHETALADARLMEFRRPARRGRPVMGLIQLDADEAPAHVPSRYQRAAGARERIEHHIARLGESFEQRRENSDRLLCRMQAVSRIGPGDHVGRRIRRRLRIALHQQISLLVLILHEARRGAVFLRENDVAGHPEASLFPRFDETIRLVPSVEAHAKTVVFQNPVHLREGRINPSVVVVVFHAAPGAVHVTHQVRKRGRHDEIDGPGGHL